MADLEKSKTQKTSFLNKIGNTLKDLETLTIRTIVGDLKYDSTKNKYVHEDGQNIDGIISEIHLAKGDIDTKMTEKFVSEYAVLREYHQLKEIKGQEIVRKNLELIKQIAETIISLAKDKPNS